MSHSPGLMGIKVVYTFAETVRLRRRAKGWTQVQLALETGLDRSFISDVERCRKCPSLATCALLADALGFKISFR